MKRSCSFPKWAAASYGDPDIQSHEGKPFLLLLAYSLSLPINASILLPILLLSCLADNRIQLHWSSNTDCRPFSLEESSWLSSSYWNCYGMQLQGGLISSWVSSLSIIDATIVLCHLYHVHQSNKSHGISEKYYWRAWSLNQHRP